jgi:hypothetical protein
MPIRRLDRPSVAVLAPVPFLSAPSEAPIPCCRRVSRLVSALMLSSVFVSMGANKFDLLGFDILQSRRE